MELLKTLTVDDLSFGFPLKKGTIRVLDSIQFAIHKGETVSILGPSGCGKSTLLRCVAGLLKGYAGSVRWDEVEGEAGAPGNFGFVFQSPTLLPWRTVRENIYLSVELAKGRQEVLQEQEHVEQLIREAGLEQYKEFFPSQISGGMAQRVALVRALAVRPRVLLLDEPFGALDIVTRAELGLVLERLLWEECVSALVVTHDVDEAVFLGNRVLVLSERPARVLEDVEVDLPRPRAVEHLSTEEFVSTSEKCRSILVKEGFKRDVVSR